MPTFAVRPARRTAIAVAAATVAATAISALPAPATATTVPGRPYVGEAPVSTVGILDVELSRAVRDAERHVQVVQERAAKRAAERAKRQAAREAQRRAAEAARSRAGQIMDLAAREAGDPYVWGAAGPSAFDCSGYTMHVFAQLGISLPHSSSAQAAMARPVSDPQVGDLVFFGGSGVYHVGIYAGDGSIWHAPRPGGVVRKEQIWTSDVFYGRVG